MRFLVTAHVLESIKGIEDNALIKVVGKQIQEIVKSPKFVDGGIFAGRRGGFFVFDVDRHAEISELLAPGIIQNFHTEVYPIMSFKEMGELFEKMKGE